MEWLADPQIWIAFATLTVLELVLGIDNIIFISILAGKLPPEQQARALGEAGLDCEVALQHFGGRLHGTGLGPQPVVVVRVGRVHGVRGVTPGVQEIGPTRSSGAHLLNDRCAGTVLQVRRTKIVATIGPASRDRDVMVELVNAGMDVARLNFSHGSHEQHAQAYTWVRQASDESGRGVPLMDALSDRWGTAPHGEGKVVCSLIQDDPYGEAGQEGLEFAAENPDAVRQILTTYTKMSEQAIANSALPVYDPNISDDDIAEICGGTLTVHGTQLRGLRFLVPNAPGGGYDITARTAGNSIIEDAIQETTVSTSGISAEYGRFTGGVVNAVTKSGGNTFSGSFRSTRSCARAPARASSCPSRIRRRRPASGRRAP